MRLGSKDSGRNAQSNYGHKYDDNGHNRALVAVKFGEPPRELGEDETGFYPLDE